MAGEEGAQGFREPAVCEVLRRLSAGESLDESAETIAALEQLWEAGVVGRVPEGIARGAVAFWEQAGLAPTAGAGVALRTYCSAGAGILGQALEANGLSIDDGAGFTVVTTDDYLLPELETFHLRQKPWLLAKPVGTHLWLGPLFLPGESACWQCLRYWLRLRRWPQASHLGVAADTYYPQPSLAALPSTGAWAAGMIATAAAVLAAGGRYEVLESAIVSVDTRTGRQDRHPFRPLGSCPHCRELKGGDWLDFLSPVTGVASDLEMTARPCGGYYLSRARFLRPLPQPGTRGLLRPDWAWGRGVTMEQAKLSCLGEAFERYSSTYQGNERLTQARFMDLGPPALDPRDVLLYSDRQYSEREDWNARHASTHSIPGPFDREATVSWVEVQDLGGTRTGWAPAAIAYMWFEREGEGEFANSDSNGCGCGNTWDEARLSALLELVERDALSIWWDNRIARPGVTWMDPVMDAAREELRGDGRTLWVLDITNDTGVPVFAAVSAREDGSQIYMAAAAHPAPVTAIRKAVGELMQIWYWAQITGPPEGMEKWLAEATLTTEPWMRPEGEAPLRAAMDNSSLAGVVDALAALGIEVWFLDLTRPELGIAAARAFAPGLRHFWARYAPGRLYEVPVRLGWLKEPRLETELNPTSCFL